MAKRCRAIYCDRSGRQLQRKYCEAVVSGLRHGGGGGGGGGGQSGRGRGGGTEGEGAEMDVEEWDRSHHQPPPIVAVSETSVRKSIDVIETRKMTSQ